MAKKHWTLVGTAGLTGLKFTAAVLFLSAGILQPANPPRDVCTILRDLPSYTGQRVAVRGRIRFGPNHFLIAPYRCEVTSEARFIVAGINLRSTVSGSRESLLRSKGRLGDLWREMDRVEHQKGQYSIVATVVGLIESGQPSGYGEMGSLPAQLTLEDVRDLRRVPNN